MANTDASVIELLTEALTKSQALTQQVEEQTETIDRLFQELTAKDIEIASLKRSLRVAQAKEQKWRLEQPHLSSPVMSDDVEAPPRVSRAATPTLSKPLTPKSSPQIRVASSPPRKRQRLATTEKTPLHEVTNIKAVPRSVDRMQKAIEAIPSLAEDGDWDHDTGKGNRGSKRTDGDRGAQNRLGALLDAPAPHNNILERRPVSASPKAQLKTRKVQPPLLQRSSSDSVQSEKPPMRKKPPFLPPKPIQQEPAPLRSRHPSSLHLSDFVPRQGLLDEWERPRTMRKLILLPDEMSDEEVLLEYLGPGGQEKLASMTRSARDNLLHDARLKRMAMRLDEARNTTKKPSNGPTYWDVDFPRTQEEEAHHVGRLQSLQDEVKERFHDALGANGRWQFRDEVKEDLSSIIAQHHRPSQQPSIIMGKSKRPEVLARQRRARRARLRAAGQSILTQTRARVRATSNLRLPQPHQYNDPRIVTVISKIMKLEDQTFARWPTAWWRLQARISDVESSPTVCQELQDLLIRINPVLREHSKKSPLPLRDIFLWTVVLVIAMRPSQGMLREVRTHESTRKYFISLVRLLPMSYCQDHDDDVVSQILLGAIKYIMHFLVAKNLDTATPQRLLTHEPAPRGVPNAAKASKPEENGTLQNLTTTSPTAYRKRGRDGLASPDAPVFGRSASSEEAALRID